MKLRCEPSHVLLLVSLVMMAGCSSSQPTAGRAGKSASSDRARPILHFDLKGSAGSQTPVTAVDDANGRRVAVLDDVYKAAWNPDGSRFAALSPDQARTRLVLKVLTLGGRVIDLFTPSAGERLFEWWGPIWAPDARRLAVLVADSSRPPVYSVVVIDVASRRIEGRHHLPTSVLAHLPSYIMALDAFRWSPDGRKILVSWETAVVIDAATGAVETVSDRPIVSEWSPSSDAIYYFETPNRRELGAFYRKALGVTTPMKLSDKEQIAAAGLTRSRFGVGLMNLSPHGSQLAIATGSTQGGVGAIYLYQMSGAAVLDLTKPIRAFHVQDVITALEWAPDEDSLAVIAASQDGLRVKVVELSTGKWRTVSTINFPTGPGDPEVVDVLMDKTLSWTR